MIKVNAKDRTISEIPSIDEVIKKYPKVTIDNSLFPGYTNETHRSRRNLITTSAVLFALYMFPITSDEIDFMGVTFSGVNHLSLVVIFVAASIYELFMFIKRANADVELWQNQVIQIPVNIHPQGAFTPAVDTSSLNKKDMLQILQDIGTRANGADQTQVESIRILCEAYISLKIDSEKTKNKFITRYEYYTPILFCVLSVLLSLYPVLYPVFVQKNV